jgi:hypothetical protein
MLGPLFGPNNEQPLAKSILAEGILKLAAEGERNPKRLRDAALIVAA